MTTYKNKKIFFAMFLILIFSALMPLFTVSNNKVKAEESYTHKIEFDILGKLFISVNDLPAGTTAETLMNENYVWEIGLWSPKGVGMGGSHHHDEYAFFVTLDSSNLDSVTPGVVHVGNVYFFNFKHISIPITAEQKQAIDDSYDYINSDDDFSADFVGYGVERIYIHIDTYDSDLDLRNRVGTFNWEYLDPSTYRDHVINFQINEIEESSNNKLYYAEIENIDNLTFYMAENEFNPFSPYSNFILEVRYNENNNFMKLSGYGAFTYQFDNNTNLYIIKFSELKCIISKLNYDILKDLTEPEYFEFLKQDGKVLWTTQNLDISRFDNKLLLSEKVASIEDEILSNDATLLPPIDKQTSFWERLWNGIIKGASGLSPNSLLPDIFGEEGCSGLFSGLIVVIIFIVAAVVVIRFAKPKK